jgi:hypothetical protein
MTETPEQHEPGDRFATGRRFPTQLDPPATGAELGEPGQAVLDGDPTVAGAG